MQQWRGDRCSHAGPTGWCLVPTLTLIVIQDHGRAPFGRPAAGTLAEPQDCVIGGGRDRVPGGHETVPSLIPAEDAAVRSADHGHGLLEQASHELVAVALGRKATGHAQKGLVPQALPHVIAYTLYRWECAIRASAILGFVGAGGLGQQIELSMRMFQFDEALTLLGILFGLVAAVDFISGRIRARVA